MDAIARHSDTNTIDLAQVAKELKVSVRTVQRHVYDGTIPAIRVGKFWRVKPDYLDKINTRKSAPKKSLGRKAER